MCNNHQLDGIEDILPQDIRRGSQRCQRVEVGVCHPDAERGVLLTESLSGGDGRDAFHGFRSGRRVDEYVLVIGSFADRRQFIADEFAETELKQAGKEG